MIYYDAVICLGSTHNCEEADTCVRTTAEPNASPRFAFQTGFTATAQTLISGKTSMTATATAVGSIRANCSEGKKITSSVGSVPDALRAVGILNRSTARMSWRVNWLVPSSASRNTVFCV